MQLAKASPCPPEGAVPLARKGSLWGKLRLGGGDEKGLECSGKSPRAALFISTPLAVWTHYRFPINLLFQPCPPSPCTDPASPPDPDGHGAGAPGLWVHFEGDPRSQPFQKAVGRLHSPQSSSGVCSGACDRSWDWGQFTELQGPCESTVTTSSLRTRPASPLSQPVGRGLLAAHPGVLRLSGWKQNPPGALGLGDGRGLGHQA